MRFVLPAPRHFQNPLVRVAATVVAVLCLGALFVFGALALAILLVGGGLWLIWFRWHLHRLRKQAAAGETAPDSTSTRHDNVIEGEYVVIHEQRHTTR